MRSGVAAALRRVAMIVYLHNRYVAGTPDENERLNAAIRPWYYKKAPFHAKVPDSQIKHVVINDRMSVRQVVGAVQTASPKPKSIWHLLINTHGNAGRIDVGTGLTPTTAREFALLKPYMNPGGAGTLIGACGAASGKRLDPSVLDGLRGKLRCQSSADNGLTTMMIMAREMGVPVRGGVDAQFTWILNGPVVLALPDGRILLTDGRVEPQVRSKVA
jgi:hypothetical protein